MTDQTFAGYPIVGDAMPIPGGTESAAQHPLLRTPVALRRYRADWVGPADTVGAFAERAKAAAPVTHAHLAHLLDAGVADGEAYAAVEAFPGADLQTLVGDIGPMPAPLAAGYARQAAEGLAAAHARGVVHGHVRPACLRAGPLTPMSRPRPDGTPRMRPSAAAAVRVFELGLVPLRPPLAEWAGHPNADAAGLAYLPPERVDASAPTPAGDVYGLGASLYFLLTGRPPYSGSASDVVGALRSAAPTPLAALRPDLPADLTALVAAMLSQMPMARPTAADVAARLARIGTVPPPPPVSPPPASDIPAEHPLGPVELMDTGSTVKGVLSAEELAPDPAAEAEADLTPLVEMGVTEPAAAGAWVVTPYEGPPSGTSPTFHPPEVQAYPVAEPAGFDPHADEHHDDAPAPKRRPADRGKLFAWLGVGLGLQVLAVVGWVYLIAQPGCTKPNPPANGKAKR